MFRRTAIWFLGSGVAAALALAAISLAGRSGGAAATEDPIWRALPVATIRLSAVSSYSVPRVYTGTLHAARTTDLGFERPGKVLRVLVDQGDRVEVGQPLAELDRRHLEARQAQLEAQRDEAAAQLAELEAGPRAQQIAAARAEVRRLDAELKLQETRFHRRERLQETAAISGEEWDTARFSLQVAEAQLEAARQVLDELLAGTRQERIDAARAAVTQLEAALRDLEHDLEDCTLRAPFTAMVSARYIDDGTVVDAATPVVRLVESDRMEAWVGVPPDVAATLTVGSDLRVRVGDHAHTATLEAILAQLDTNTRTQRVVLSLKTPAATGLVPGRLARLEIEESIPGDGFWLPTSSLSRGKRGLWSCLAVVPDESDPLRQIVERREVEVLYTDGQRVLVRGTLQPGERVVANGTHRLVPGQAVSEETVASARPATAAVAHR
jgi:multidrug efflux pump subunit AcrA (membrane-fusion protein)